MSITPFYEQDYLEVARNRVTEQFKYDTVNLEGKSIFDKYLQLLIAEKQELQSVYKDLMQLRSVDTASGVNLDILGEIVGQERALLSVDVLDYFGFLGKVNAGGFGSLDDPAVGAMFYSVNSPKAGNVLLTDEVYRLFIKAKIFKNNTRVTPEDFIQAIMLIFGVDKVSITEGSAMITTLVGKKLSSMEVALLDYVSYSNGYPSRLIPKPVGVGVKWGTFDSNNFFGFLGVAGAKGFGSLKQTAGYGLGYGLDYGVASHSLIEGSGGVMASLY